MRVRRETIREVVDHRYGDVMTERQKENMVAAVQRVLEGIIPMDCDAEILGAASAARNLQHYRDVKWWP